MVNSAFCPYCAIGNSYDRAWTCTHLICVVHAHSTAAGWEIVHFPFLAFATIRGSENDLEFSRLVHHKVCGSVLYSNTATSMNTRKPLRPGAPLIKGD